MNPILSCPAERRGLAFPGLLAHPFRTSRSRGTGLGLAVVQRFVKNIGGIIKLANQQPHGACVTVLLPKECLAGGYHD